VPGLGVSEPLRLDAHAWRDAFRHAMHGFLVQRSGLALGPPVTDFIRPRDLHPQDGVNVYASAASIEQAYAADNWFDVLTERRTARIRPEAWGGYHDAGDYDRSSNHLWATYLHLELADLFPAYFARLSLALPADETGNTLPDLLDEALWNLDCFRRLQEADGGVGAGIESSAHPRKGEASHLDSLALFTYAPDAVSSYLYAATAARAARLLQPGDPALAATYRSSALRAWAWAEPHRATATGKGYQSVPVRDARATAAVELLALTREARFDAAYLEDHKLADASSALIEQQGAAFAYARLPEGLGDPALKSTARTRLLRQADEALAYAEANAFGLTTELRDLPLIGPVGAFTTPGMISQILPRAHALSGDTRYLAGTVRACQFAAGANPENMTFTTGVGYHSPQAPLHFDSRFTGQKPPAGLTVYGAYVPESLPDFSKSNEWAHIWLLGKTTVPSSFGWPAAEGYYDVVLWPMINEFTIRQTMGPTSYYWGYLAACPR
jgi:endoglucanase